MTGDPSGYRQSPATAASIFSLKAKNNRQWHDKEKELIYNNWHTAVVEWQTRWTQNPLPSKACWFKSSLRHHHPKAFAFGFLLPFVALSGLLKRAFVYRPCPVVNARGHHETRILLPGSAVRAAAEQPS